MPHLTEFLLRHKLAVVAAWLVVLVAGVAAAGVVPGRLSQEFSFPGEEGYEANVAILRSYGNGGPGNPLVPVVTLPPGTTVDSPGAREALDRAFSAVAADQRLRVLAWPATTDDRRLVVDGGRTVYGLVWGPYQGPDGGDPDIGPALAERLRGALPAGATVQVTGLDELRAEAATEPADTGVLVETLAGGLGALVVLAFVFGSFLALVPLLVAAVAILTTFLAVLGLTGLVEVSFIAQFLVALIGLGVAVDYSLLLVTRWREELAAGHDREQAVHRAMATAGRAVVTSGGTVAVGLLALVLLPVPFLRSIGYAGLLIPLAATLVTLTLLPVLLATVGPRLDWPAGRRWSRRGAAGRARGASRLWTGWAAGVARHRWLATLAALVVLVPLGVAALGLRLGEPPAAVLAHSGPAREALDTLERAGVGSGVLTPIEVLVPAGVDRRETAGRLAGVAGVQAAVAPSGPAWERDGSGLVSVLPVSETSGDAGEATVERVRDLAATELPEARVGGSGALAVDATRALYGSFPLMLAAVAVVTFLLLARAFRSLLLAFKAIVLNLLSIGAAYGVLVLVWQEGFGSQAIWGIPATGAIAMWVPLMAFAFLYGLSMDYEVFLLARMREEYDRTGSTETAIVQGLGRVGRLVTCAALILFLSFASMAAVPELDVKIMATALGAGILIDATILRILLVPALVALLGRWNWWLPAWAARLLLVPPSVPTPEPTAPAPELTGVSRPRSRG
ncbi:MAG TPA: MMPL family transporter [Actinomycetes bacterium]|nr:MMPL family transporter [Actinomycetes bacterium]